ncbi:MAG: PrpR N-terminal domain-containing protein [Blautia sp.]
MRKVKILFIAPYPGLVEPINHVIKAHHDIEATIKIGDMKDGALIAKSMMVHHYDVIISRGGTAELIRKSVELPVVNIPVSVYDIIRSIKMAENYCEDFAIAGYPSITECAKILCDLLQLNTEIITFDKMEDIPQQLGALRKKGYELVICDTIGVTTASQMGMNSILISSWTESIEQAVENARSLVRSSYYYFRQKEIFQSILTSKEEDLLIYDPNGLLWFSSISKPTMQNMVYSLVQPYLPSFLQEPGQKIEKRAGSTLYSIQNRHFYPDGQKYTVITISRKEFLFSEQDQSISIYNQREEGNEDFSFSYNSANYIGNIRDTIDSYSKTLFPVLILGENGTGKDKAASIIYKNSSLQNHPLYTVDCELLGERRWSTLLSSSNSPLNSVNSTIYFKNINFLNNAQLERLISYMDQANLSRLNHLLFSYVETPGAPSSESSICNYLMNRTNCLVLRLPPLRERQKDIPSILTLYLNQLNLELGKQIIGFEPEAMDLMKNFPWPQNLNQLQRILRELAVLTTDSYITKKATKERLKSESFSASLPWQEAKDFPLDLNRSLEEINYDIIRMVLSEENNNKERAAKRLGISRSTLWRILKAHDSTQ